MTNRDAESRLDAAQAAAFEAYSTGRFEEAVELIESALADDCSAGSAPKGSALWILASSLLAVGRSAEAQAHYEQARELARRESDLRTEGRALAGMAFTAQSVGAYDRAADLFRAAIERFESLGDEQEVARASVDLGGAYYLASRLDDAAAAYEAALALLRSQTAPLDTVRVLINLGSIRLMLERPDEALAALDEAAERMRPEIGADPLRLALHSSRAEALLILGRIDEAIPDMEAARAGYEVAGDPWNRAVHAARLTDLYRWAGRFSEAISRHREMMQLESDHGFSVFGQIDATPTRAPGRSSRPRRAPSTPRGEGPSAEPAAGARPSEPTARARRQHGESARGPFVIFTPPCPGHFGPLFPRGATSIASFLQRHGIPCRVVPLSSAIDGTMEDPMARERARQVIVDALTSLSARAVGISVTFSFLYPAGLEIARLVAEVDPDLPIVIGGPHVTYWDTQCLEEAPEIDVVVRGEGEWTALELLRTLDGGQPLDRVAGITFRDDDGRIHRNPLRPLGDVGELPEIDFSVLPAKFAQDMEVYGLSSRGCIFRCRYCHEFRYWGGVVRKYPVERIVAEMERLHRDHGNPMCGIDDSMLDMTEPYFIELMDALGHSDCLPERFGLLTRLDTINAEGLKAMKRAGISSLHVGMESGSDVVLEAMNKQLTVARGIESLEKVRTAGIDLSTFFIVGHPGDNPHESEKTIALIDRLFEERLVSWVETAAFLAYPGTPFFARPAKHGVRILTLDWTRWRREGRPVCELADFSANEIELAHLRTLEMRSRHRSSSPPASGSD